jgi:Undecaprenyl-phosphate glucose phosphotransferase
MGNVIREPRPDARQGRSSGVLTQVENPVVYLNSVAALHHSDKDQRWRKISADLSCTIIACLDLAIVLGSAQAVFTCYFWSPIKVAHYPTTYLSSALIAAIIFVGVFERLQGYSLKRLRDLRFQLSHIVMVWGIVVSIVLLVGFVGQISGAFSRGWALLWFGVVPILLSGGRTIQHTMLTRRLNDGSLARSVVIVGAGEEGQRLVRRLRQHNDQSFLIRGIFDDRESRRPEHIDGCPVLGTTDDLLSLARAEWIDEVVVALPLAAGGRLKELFDKLTAIPTDLRLSVDEIAVRLPIRGVDYLAATPVLTIVDRPMKHGRGVCKWLEDKILASVLMILTGPVLLLLAILIKLDSRGPVLFVQRRIGFNNNVIRVFKFRTMYANKCDQSGAQRTVQDDPRVTRIGRILRTLSLDELPQLINVVCGEMSLVGPRPHAVAMKAGDRLYEQVVASYPRRHRMKPGITGWAQVNGFRGEVDTLEKARGRVEYDLYYITHWSLWLDVKIMAKTFGVLISRSNAY